MSERKKVGTDIEFIRYLKEHGGDTMKKCYQCATCSVACELSPKEYAFPRKEMIKAAWGQKEDLLSDPDVWLCHGCMDCSQQCPRSARPADLMSAIRSYVYRAFSYPKFMGKALASPRYLPALFTVSVVAILLLVLSTNAIFHDFDMSFTHVKEGKLSVEEFIENGGSFNSEEELHHYQKKDGIVDYEYYASHGGVLPEKEFLEEYGIIQYNEFVNKTIIEVFFIPLNFLIFGLAYVGLRNYWKSMEKNYIGPVKKKFLPSAFAVLGDFLKHNKFEKCPTNSNRHWGHIYTFYGFIGTMIATFIVVLGEFYEWGILKIELFHLPYPMGLMHPVKILGMVSGIFMVIGLVMLFIKRLQTEERDGKSTYNDWLFLWVILAVVVTGILNVFVRLPEPHGEDTIVAIANIVYFIHLVLVFFLLVYMPWSKFAHMIYRFTGLIYLKMHGRENKPEVFAESKN